MTVICETAGARVTSDAVITVAEPGWTMWMVSHFHYDPVWWNTQGQFTEARLVLPDEDGEMPDTRTAFDLVHLHLEKARRDPDYKFVLAEIDYLKPHFDAFPQDRAYLRSLLADGRVELVGGTYNEPNTNLTGAETTIRNAVYGMGFQRGVLGAEVGSAWMLDAFGFDPGFPGPMAGAGLTSSSWARGPSPTSGVRTRTPGCSSRPSSNGSPRRVRAADRLHGQSLRGRLDAAHRGRPGGRPRSGPHPVQLAGDGGGDAERDAAGGVRPRDPGPVGNRRGARVWAKRYVWPRFVPAVPREFFAAVRAASEATPSRYWIMPQTRDMNPVYMGE